MFIGITAKPVEISTFDIVIGKYRVLSDNTGTPDRMKGAVEFTAKHGILPDIEVRPGGLEEVNGMVQDMQAGRFKGRMGIVFD